MTQYKRDWRSLDWVLAVMVILLCFFGLLMIASATGVATGKPVTPAAARAFRPHPFWIASGVLIMVTFAVLDFEWVGKMWLGIYGLNLLLLGLALIFGKSDEYARWLTLSDFGIPLSFGIQPSEFTKIFLIIYLSKFLSRFEERINNPLVVIGAMGSVFVPVALIMMQPSLSASLVPIVILLTLLFVSKISYRYIIIALLIIVPLVVFLLYDLHRENKILLSHLSDKQLLRIESMLYPDENSTARYQTNQSVAAIAAGGMTGKGLFKHTIFVPYAYNDFIISTVGEEFGFLGIFLLVLYMGAICAKIIIHGFRCPYLYGRLLCAGVASMFAFQTFVNVTVATDLLPNTGMSFPFISTGGSSMWINMAAVGLVISVGTKKNKSMFED